MSVVSHRVRMGSPVREVSLEGRKAHDPFGQALLVERKMHDPFGLAAQSWLAV